MKQERLRGIFAEGLLAPEPYRKQVIPLRDEERTLRDDIKRLNINLIEKEKSKNYRDLLVSVTNHFDLTGRGKIDAVGKKGLLRLLFKRVEVENGKVGKIELFEPFRSLYEGEDEKWQLTENQQVPANEGCVYTCAPSVDDWFRWRGMVLKLLKSLRGAQKK